MDDISEGMPPLPGLNASLVQKVYTPEEVEELRRRIRNSDDSYSLEESIDRLEVNFGISRLHTQSKTVIWHSTMRNQRLWTRTV